MKLLKHTNFQIHIFQNGCVTGGGPPPCMCYPKDPMWNRANKHLKTHKFRFEDWKTLQNYLCKHDLIQKAVIIIMLMSTSLMYLGFFVVTSRRNKIFRFLCFTVWALNSPLHVYKTMQTHVRLWRFHGIRIVLDHGFSIAESYLKCMSD